MKKIINELIPYVIILVVVVIIRTFIITPVTVSGSSMSPTLKNKELLLLSKISYKVNDIKRFDVVVIEESDEPIIKRIIGLPGENVSYSDNKLYINGKELEDKYGYGETSDFDLKDVCLATYMNEFNTDKDRGCTYDEIPEDYYLVLGDNRKISKDSRSIGLISKDEIIGKTVVRFWPLNKISLVK